MTLLNNYNLPNLPQKDTEYPNCLIFTLKVESAMKNNLFMMKPLLMEVNDFTGKIFQIFRNNSANLKETLHGTQKKEMLPKSLYQERIILLQKLVRTLQIHLS